MLGASDADVIMIGHKYFYSYGKLGSLNSNVIVLFMIITKNKMKSLRNKMKMKLTSNITHI